MARTIGKKIIDLCQIVNQKITLEYLFIIHCSLRPLEKKKHKKIKTLADYQNKLRNDVNSSFN